MSGGRVLASRIEPMERGQAERLLPLLEETLAEAGLSWRDLAAVAVCTGPGNFTGLRIGVAAARGLALALGVPAIGVTRLEALAHGRAGVALAAFDARRGQVWAQTFRDGIALAPAALIDRDALAGAAPGALRIGDADPAGQGGAFPDPAALARIAATRLGRAAPPPAPLYLRPADAAPAAEPAPLILDDA